MKYAIISFYCLIAFFLWQLLVFSFQLPHYILPSPWQVLLTLKAQYILIAHHTLPTLLEILLGFILSIFFGCMAGILVSCFRPLSRGLLPLLIVSQAIPTFAIAPLLVIWFGYGITSKIMTTIFMLFFPITCALYDGIRQTNPLWLDLTKTMNGKKWRVFYYVRLPAALPSLASGIRIAAATAPIGAIVGEWVGSSQGLGYLMLMANARMEIELMFAILLIIILIALILYFSVDKLLQKLIWWQLQ